MKIFVIIVTCNRLQLLANALDAVQKQTRKPDGVYIISNSLENTRLREQEMCNALGFQYIKNYRTPNNAGAINTGIEEVVRQMGISDHHYLALLDDDDEWHPHYLEILDKTNDRLYDVLLAELSRKNNKKEVIQTLPNIIDTDCFLKGNPGIGNSNTFVKLPTLLKAGCFDEFCISNIDRDLFIRLFQLTPTYKVVHQHLVTHNTDNDRPRITNNANIREKSFQYFYYKYAAFMSEETKQAYFDWAENLFGIEQSKIQNRIVTKSHFFQKEICFDRKGNDFQFIIGFIADNDEIATRAVRQIIEKIPVDLVLIIDNSNHNQQLNNTQALLLQSNLPFKIVSHDEWNTNLTTGYYSEYFKKFNSINSIPLGRTILHHHLYDATTHFEKPVFWIIDDDIDFNAISTSEESFSLFDLINEHLSRTDAIIGGISNDPPIPALSCIRTQLVDFVYSFQAHSMTEDFAENFKNIDYYYDLSDLHSHHLEAPILHSAINEHHLHQIFSGKAVFRPTLQRELKAEYKTITRRGANTLVLNREVLRLHPVINLEVNGKFARRGDLTWALFNQVLSHKNVVEHTFCINHNRPLFAFNLDKELEKSAYDIVGYAFNKAIFRVIEQIKQTNQPTSESVFSHLLTENNFQALEETYIFYLERRKTRFFMNYYRIMGLTKLIWERFGIGKQYYEICSDETKIAQFENIIQNARSVSYLKLFLEELQKVAKNIH